MGAYAMKELRKNAIACLKRGIRKFCVYGADVRIDHKHHNEYGVMVYDPVAGQDVELLRLYNDCGNIRVA